MCVCVCVCVWCVCVRGVFECVVHKYSVTCRQTRRTSSTRKIAIDSLKSEIDLSLHVVGIE